jgi:hypothetical protein
MRTSRLPLLLLALAIAAAARTAVAAPPAVAAAPEHPGNDYLKQNGYAGSKSCEECHPGTAKSFTSTVHWTHGSRVTNVDGVDPKQAYGMANRIYTFCNGNDLVNDLKESAKNDQGKVKLSGCSSCHPGDHLSGVGSTGPEAEAAVDCLLCHSSKYDFSKRKPYKMADGRVAMAQDRSLEAALAVGKPGVKNCMTCHESAGGGVMYKRGFAFDAEHDAHAAKGMVCADCHKAKDHRIPTGTDPNNWANDGVRLSCAGCHGEKPHKDPDYDAHVARIACQTCHIPTAGGVVAKDFTRWSKDEATGWWEPTTINRAPSSVRPVLAWYNGQVRNEPHFIGPKGARTDGKSRIAPFRVYEGRAFYDRKSGQLLSMDFGPPAGTGDTLAGVASAAKTLGLKGVDPVPGWQTIYFSNSHLVTKAKALSCDKCHTASGALDFEALGYTKAEIEKRQLRSAALWFDKLQAKEAKKAEW